MSTGFPVVLFSRYSSKQTPIAPLPFRIVAFVRQLSGSPETMEDQTVRRQTRNIETTYPQPGLETRLLRGPRFAVTVQGRSGIGVLFFLVLTFQVPRVTLEEEKVSTVS